MTLTGNTFVNSSPHLFLLFFFLHLFLPFSFFYPKSDCFGQLPAATTTKKRTICISTVIL